jgi:hypothetical protein
MAKKHDGDEQSMTKRETVRQALAAGYDRPKTAIPWIKERFRIDLHPNEFSQNKIVIRKQGAKRVTMNQHRSNGLPGHDPIDFTRRSMQLVEKLGVAAVLDVVDLVEQHSADAVRQMVELFRK